MKYGHSNSIWLNATPKLAGEQIPISARIVAIADVYDALTTKRVYKSAFTHEKAVEIIQESRGTHFDPDLVDAFENVEDQMRAIRSRLDEGCIDTSSLNEVNRLPPFDENEVALSSLSIDLTQSAYSK